MKCRGLSPALFFNHPLQGWDEAAYLTSRVRNKVPRLAVERAVLVTFRRRIVFFSTATLPMVVR